MENCNINSDTGQDRTERQSVWRITTISVLTLDKIKLNDNSYRELLFRFWHDKIKLNDNQHGEQLFHVWDSWTRKNWMTIHMENYYFSSDSGKDDTEWRSVWRNAITVVTLDKIKLNDNQHGKLLFQFWHCRRFNLITISVLTLDKSKQNDNHYGGLPVLFWHWTR